MVVLLISLSLSEADVTRPDDAFSFRVVKFETITRMVKGVTKEYHFCSLILKLGLDLCLVGDVTYLSKNMKVVAIVTDLFTLIEFIKWTLLVFAM